MGDERRTSERIIMVLLLEDDDDDDDDDGEEERSRLEEEARAVALDDEARVNMGPGRFLRLDFFSTSSRLQGSCWFPFFYFFRSQGVTAEA